jgi:hypothetical protein
MKKNVKCLSCKFSSFPTKDNGDLIHDEEDIFKGRCSNLNKSITIKSSCSYSEESNILKIAELLNEHNNKIMKKIHEESETMFWDGNEWADGEYKHGNV